jgi:RsiW-degrading membrane proteinase PrsW (M82 family)
VLGDAGNGSILMKMYWPWVLLIAAAIALYLAGYRHVEHDSSPLPLFILIVAVVGGCFALDHYQRRR